MAFKYLQTQWSVDSILTNQVLVSIQLVGQSTFDKIRFYLLVCIYSSGSHAIGVMVYQILIIYNVVFFVFFGLKCMVVAPNKSIQFNAQVLMR
jgi:hypothetical protein